MSEAYTRTQIDTWLTNLGWDKKSVFLEGPRIEKEKALLGGKRPDYVLYSSKEAYRKEPLVVIEAKKKGSYLYRALEQGKDYARKLSAPLVFASDGNFCKSLHVLRNQPLYFNDEEITDLISENLALKFLEENRVSNIPEKVRYSREKLIEVFNRVNNILRGTRSGYERLVEFSNILFLKILSEIEYEKKDTERRISDHLLWDDWKNKTGEELLDHINNIVIHGINKKYKDEPNILSKVQIKEPSILKEIIDELDPLSLINVNSDVKGDAFEYFLRKSTVNKNNDLGEYFTPRHIVEVMVELVNPKIGETVYDPFCGTGGMLIQAFKHIAKRMADKEENWNKLKQDSVFGNELLNTSRLAKMNMILAGDGHSNIKEADSLSNPIEDKYDCVITNMPFSQITNRHNHLYDIPAGKGKDNKIALQCAFKALKKGKNSRMAIVVPEGVLFRGDYQKMREYLIERANISRIISLPQGVFYPYTGSKANILYLENIKSDGDEPWKRQKEFWYFEVKNDGFSLDAKRRKLEGEDDLRKLLTHKNDDDENLLNAGFKRFSYEECKENNFELFANRYEKFTYETQWELVQLSKVITAVVPPIKIKAENYSKDGLFPIIDQSQNEISGWSNNEDALVKNKGPLIIFGDHTGIVKYIDKPFIQGADGIKILKTNKKITAKVSLLLLKDKTYSTSWLL